MDHHTIPPHHHEAEQGVLGSCFVAPAECIPLVGGILRPEHFHDPAHQTIYGAILEAWQATQAVDLILVTKALRAAGKLEAVGGAATLTALIDYTPTAANATYYAEIVREHAHLRALWQTCRQVAEAAGRPGADLPALASTVRETLGTLTAGTARGALTMREHIGAALERYEAAALRDERTPAGVLPTGLEALDAEIEGGFHPGDLVVVAAETSGGKTAFAVQVAARSALRENASVLVASFEMTAPQLVDRMVAMQSGIASARLRGGKLTGADYARLVGVVSPLAEANIHLRDGISHWTVDDVAAEARAIKASHGLTLVVVDYLQLANPRTVPRGPQRNREREVAEISRTLKGLAVELNVVVLALSQLNEDGRLRESRALGHDADAVVIIATDPEERADRRLLKLDKNRHGARDRQVPVLWDGPTMRFSDAPPTVSRVKDL